MSSKPSTAIAPTTRQRTFGARAGFGRLSPWAARCVLAITAVTITWFVTISLSANAIDYAAHPRGGHGDIELYQAEIRRIHQGEGYYQAANAELRPRGYPVRSVFNWRTPLPMWLLGVLPSDAAGRALIGLLAAALVAIAVHVMAGEANARVGIFCGVLLIGALMPCWLKDTYVMPVVWAGVLIGLSVCAYAIDRRDWGFTLG